VVLIGAPFSRKGKTMTEVSVGPERRDEYLTTNERKEAVDALEMTARFLKEVETNPDRWKWAIIALHNAVQAFMVLALKGTWSVTVEHRDQRTKKLKAQQEFYRATEAGDKEAAAAANEVMVFGEGDLAAFIRLYDRTKDPKGIMRQYTNSKVFVPRAKDDMCMECLNNTRNEFMHFMPMTRGFLLTQFPAITDTGLHVIAFLVNESNNVTWHRGIDEDDFEPRVHAALERAYAALARIQADYEGLAPPVAPLCGSVPED
jgi:hypothetical protein